MMSPLTPPAGAVLPLEAPRDLHVRAFSSGELDPDETVLGDALRPLVVYALDGMARLRLVKTSEARVRLLF